MKTTGIHICLVSYKILAYKTHLSCISLGERSHHSSTALAVLHILTSASLQQTRLLQMRTRKWKGAPKLGWAGLLCRPSTIAQGLHALSKGLWALHTGRPRTLADISCSYSSSIQTCARLSHARWHRARVSPQCLCSCMRPRDTQRGGWVLECPPRHAQGWLSR